MLRNKIGFLTAPVVSLGLALTLVACGAEGGPVTLEVDESAPDMADVDSRYTVNGGLRWGTVDDPSIFTSDLEYRLASLPLEGEATRIPWAGNYWPTYQDNINYKWAGANSKSASEKYGEAFGVTGVPDKVSRYRGIDAYETRKACKQDSECDSTMSEQCAIREGKTDGRCIPTWWGICHAWAPVSIMEPEPIQPVVHNGVEFKVQDIKALLTLTYDRTTSKFVSLRCDENAAKNEIEYDKYGRPTGADAACADTNAGTFHVIVANYLGMRRESFVEDRTFDHEVWNQPMRGFKVDKLEEVTFARANELVGATSSGGTSDKKSGDLAKDAWGQLAPYTVTAGSKVSIVMTGTGDADLYARFGKAPDAAGFDCRPYDSGSAESCELTVPTGVTQLFVGVHGYEASHYEVTVTYGGSVPTAYVFNPDAKKWFWVKLTSKYISESSAGTDGNLASTINQYTHSDAYEYVLELGADDKIIGGEWVGNSKKAHPDFLWLPTGRSYTSVASGAITYANVKSLLDRSVGSTGGGGGGGTGGSTEVKTVNQAGTVAKDEWKHFGPFDVVSGNLKVVMTGGGDADLFVKKGAQPTAAAYDCRPYANGSAETCDVAGPGQIYVSVNGYAASSNFNLVITYTGAVAGGGGGGGGTGGTGVTHLNVTGDVAQGASKAFTVNVKAGKNIVIKTTGPKDIDLYVKMNTAPTTSSYTKSSTGYTGAESITYTPPNDGVLHILIYGYEASTFTLVTSDS